MSTNKTIYFKKKTFKANDYCSIYCINNLFYFWKITNKITYNAYTHTHKDVVASKEMEPLKDIGNK